MANTNVVEIEVNTKLLGQQVKAVSGMLSGLDRVLSSIAQGVEEAFAVRGYEDYKDTVTRFGKELADELLVLQLSFGRMKYAIAEAVAPIASVFVPMLNTAIQAVIRFSGVVRQFLSGLIAGITGRQELADSAENAARAETKMGSAAKSAGKAVKRSLASFDELERLNQASGSGGSGGSGGGVDLWGGFAPDPISPEVQALVDKVLALLAPLMAINLEPLRLALQTLWTSFTQLASVVGEGLSFLWYELLTPLAAWILEQLAPAFAEGIAAKLDMVAAALEPVIEGLKILWDALQPVVAFIGETVIMILEKWKETYVMLTQVLQQKAPVITGIFQNIAQMATSMWAIVGPVLTNLRQQFSGAFSSISASVATAVGYILDALLGLTGFLAGAFSGNWQQAWEGIRLFLKSIVNGVISLLNGMISRLVSALNAVISTANRLSFTVPSWVPGIGGKKFGVNMSQVSAPQIPYLAQGAVLPANHPFLAVVGDQKHGTNIEAPLATIQEAVATVLADQSGAIIRGFEASVAVQKDILEAVLGITIGDDLLGRAVERYNHRMAIVRGGIG